MTKEYSLILLQSIEKELLERLKRGVYGDIYNYPVKEYNKVLDMEGLQAASEDEEEEVKWFRLIYICIYIYQNNFFSFFYTEDLLLKAGA